jgi:hypothetical protein
VICLWHVNRKGQKEYLGGNDDWQGAAQAARACLCFTADDEDEQVADEHVSCYNCRYRRWGKETFVCCK